MPKLGELKFDADTAWHTCKHRLGDIEIDIYLETGEETAAIDRLAAAAQSISDDWETRHPRLAELVARELTANGYLDESAEFDPGDCLPFYLGVAVDPDGEISYTISFSVSSVLDGDEEYADVEEEIDGAWVNTEVCSSE
jgi:hypothetical protein